MQLRNEKDGANMQDTNTQTLMQANMHDTKTQTFCNMTHYAFTQIGLATTFSWNVLALLQNFNVAAKRAATANATATAETLKSFAWPKQVFLVYI